VSAEGGLPLIADGKIIGGIGVSGASGQEDRAVALSSARQASSDLTTAIVPQGRLFPLCRGNAVISLMPATRQPSLSTS
jgi:hypothetical protein